MWVYKMELSTPNYIDTVSFQAAVSGKTIDSGA